MKINLTVQDILLAYANDYLSSHSLSKVQRKTVEDMMKCKTEACGIHTDTCEHCGHLHSHFNSCHNRNCNYCQAIERERWIHRETYNTLDNIKYFHIVFTVPSELHSLFLYNPTTCLNILFKCSADSLKKLASDEKYLDAQIGFTSVLHTWGQNLSYHPHIHVIASGGGLDSYGKWKKSKDQFFLPVKALSKLFRGKFLSMMEKEKDLHLPEGMNRHDVLSLISKLYDKDWVVYTKKPFKDCSHVIKYLGRYTHRVAISNSRLVSCENGKVQFSYKDYKDKDKIKIMELDTNEFIRRYLMHVLPSGFMKIRHYGFLSNGNKQKRLTLCKELTHTPILAFVEIPTLQLLSKMMNKDVSLCDNCGMLRHPLLE